MGVRVRGELCVGPAPIGFVRCTQETTAAIRGRRFLRIFSFVLAPQGATRASRSPLDTHHSASLHATLSFRTNRPHPLSRSQSPISDLRGLAHKPVACYFFWQTYT